MSDSTLVLLAAFAIAGAIALVAWVSSSRSEKKGPVRPTRDWNRVHKLLGRGGIIAEGVSLLLSVEPDPTTWRLAPALKRLDTEDGLPNPVRAVLTALYAQENTIVRQVAPRAGERFSVARMVDVSPIPEAHPKNVVDLLQVGWKVESGGVPVKARVRCETVDHYLLISGTGQVGSWIRDHIDELVSADPELQRAWRARDGLRGASRIRGAFGHQLEILDSWREDLAARFAREYDGSGLEPPLVGPRPGQPLDLAWMKRVGGPSSGDTVVSKVVSLGLAAPGGGPILTAVVEVRPAVEWEAMRKKAATQ